VLDGGVNGSGGDTVSYAASGAGVSVDLTSAGAQSGGDAAGDMLSNFENVTGSNHNDTLTGNVAANILKGGLGDDTIVGGAGADTIDGGAGVDTVSYSGLGALVTVTLGANGVQTIGKGGDAEGDKITNVENVTGSGFGDFLTGNNLGNVLFGGAGSDQLTGGLGADTFGYNAASEGSDTIVDFVSGTDKIGIVKAGFGGGLSGTTLDPSFFVSGSGATSPDNTHGYFTFDTSTHQLFWDADGTDAGVAQLIATFSNSAVLTAADFDLR
jgi:Ca2+-binding RTX toxin-like protein